MLELRGGGVLMRPGGGEGTGTAKPKPAPPPPPAQGGDNRAESEQSSVGVGEQPLVTLSSSASFSSSSASKSRKEQLTDRLSRSRRSRFFSAAPSTATSGECTEAGPSEATTTTAAVTTTDTTTKTTTRASSLPATTVPPTFAAPSSAERKRIALARAHKKSPKNATATTVTTTNPATNKGGGGTNSTATITANTPAKFSASPFSLFGMKNSAIPTGSGGGDDKKLPSAPSTPVRVAVATSSSSASAVEKRNLRALVVTRAHHRVAAAAATSAASAARNVQGEIVRSQDAQQPAALKQEPAKKIEDQNGSDPSCRETSNDPTAKATAVATLAEEASSVSRPRLCLGASPFSAKTKTSSNEARVGSIDSPSTNLQRKLLGSSLLAVRAKAAARPQQLPYSAIPWNDSSLSLGSQHLQSKSPEEGSPDALLLLQSVSSSSEGSGSGASSSRQSEQSSATSTSLSSGKRQGEDEVSLPKELPPPTFQVSAPSASGPSKWKARQHQQQIVIPVQAPPAAISDPVAILPATLAATAPTGPVGKEATDDPSSQMKKALNPVVGPAPVLDVPNLSRWKRKKSDSINNSSELAAVAQCNSIEEDSDHNNSAILTRDSTPSPGSPTRVNPWKQMSKVRSASSAVNTTAESCGVVKSFSATKVGSSAGKATGEKGTPTPQQLYLHQLRSNRGQVSPKPFHGVSSPAATMPARVANRWGARSVAATPSDSVGIEKCASLDSHHFHHSFIKNEEFEVMHEEKKEDEDGYIDPPSVSVLSRMSRYEPTTTNRSHSPSIPASMSRGPSPIVLLGKGTPSPVPFPKVAPLEPPKNLAAKPLQDTLISLTEAAAAETSLREPGVAGGALIETPDKVSVSSMKARFASPTIASSTRGGGKSPGPNKRFPRPPQQPSSDTCQNHSVGRSRGGATELARSQSVGRFASPTLASQQKTTTPDRSKQAISPRSSSTIPRSPGPSIETPDRVNVSNMKARFSKPTLSKASFLQPTLSSSAKSSPRKEVTPPQLPSPSSRSSTRNEQVAVVNDVRSVIETPDPVNVKSMHGVFSGTKSEKGSYKKSHQGSNYSSSPVRSASNLSPPVRSMHHAVRERSVDVATPNAPPIPPRSAVASARELRTPDQPSWIKRTPTQGQKASYQPGDVPSSLSMPALEEADLEFLPARSKEANPQHRPKSPRERPTNIPRWKQFQALDVAATASLMVVQDDAPAESDEMCAIQENCPPASPRSPKDRPWNKDLDSPRGWRLRFQNSLDQRMKAHEGVSATSAGVTHASSLTQLAADSAHAVDFERGVSALDLKKCSGSGSGSHEFDEHSGWEGTIPNELPVEFAESLELHLDSKSTMQDRVVQRTEIPGRIADNLKTETLPTGGIVFGDPSTYGAAGGDAEATPPPVKDRANAIANWKGGLGARPSKSNSTDTDNKALDELLASKSSSNEVIENESLKSPAIQEREKSPSIEEEATDPFIEGDLITKSRKESLEMTDRIAICREEKSETSGSAIVKSPAGSRRGASAVLRFWADTSQEEVDEAQGWMNCDPDLRPAVSRPESPSLRKMFISNTHKPRVEDINLASLSEWKRLSSSPVANLNPAGNERDPFSLETLAGLYEEPVKGVPVLQDNDSPVFDPFFDTGESAFGSDMIDFFKASIRVKDGLSSPAPTTFSAPNFEPKTYEDPAQEDFGVDQRFDDRRSSISSRGGRRTSWGLSMKKKNRRSNI